MAGPKKKGLKHPSFAGSDTEPYNVGPMKKKPKQMGPKKAMKPKQMKRMGY